MKAPAAVVFAYEATPYFAAAAAVGGVMLFRPGEPVLTAAIFGGVNAAVGASVCTGGRISNFIRRSVIKVLIHRPMAAKPLY